MFALLHLENFFFNGVFGDELDAVYGIFLSDAVRTVGGGLILLVISIR